MLIVHYPECHTPVLNCANTSCSALALIFCQIGVCPNWQFFSSRNLTKYVLKLFIRYLRVCFAYSITDMKFNLTSQTELCGLDTRSECQDEVSANILTAVNITSLIINTLHIVILNRLPSLKGKPYLDVLVVISVADLAYSAVTVAVTNCQIRHAVALSSHSQLWNLINSVLARVTGAFRYVAILLSM